MRRILMIAYHFPPLAGSSGIQRTLRLAQHLPALGWQPIILTTHQRAYERCSQDLLGDVPPETEVYRAQAWDTARHFSIAGRYPAALARPDRWATWRFDGVRLGRRLIDKFKPDLLWCTYPIATAMVIGTELQRLTGVPLVADFRDPMAQIDYPADPTTRAQFRDIEERAIGAAVLSTFTTRSAAAEYRVRYPSADGRIQVLENGYDEDAFVDAEAMAAQGPLNPGAQTLLHSGVIYPSERDPSKLIAALGQLHRAAVITPKRLKIRFRASSADDLLRQLGAQEGVLDYLELLPPIGYRAALSEMMRADGLLLLQAANCNSQVPAKLYEYLRSGRPILGLTDAQGDTAAALAACGVSRTVGLDDTPTIAKMLEQIIRGDEGDVARGWRDGLVANPALARQTSRRERTRQFAEMLSQIS